jgi:hypothetical protein
MNPKLKLAQVTGDDLSDELRDPPSAAEGEFRQVLGPAPASRGLSVPTLSDAVQALLIMHGLQAQYVINYWRVTRRKEGGQFPVGVHVRPGQKYRMNTGVSKDGSFAEWQSAIKSFVVEQ